MEVPRVNIIRLAGGQNPKAESIWINSITVAAGPIIKHTSYFYALRSDGSEKENITPNIYIILIIIAISFFNFLLLP